MPWRQQRTALAGLAVLATGLSAWLVVTGLSVRSAVTAITRMHCHPSSSATCLALYERVGSWNDSYGPQWTIAIPESQRSLSALR